MSCTEIPVVDSLLHIVAIVCMVLAFFSKGAQRAEALLWAILLEVLAR